MLIEESLRLASATYKLTRSFPEGEVLIFQIRRSANKLVEDLTLEKKIRASQRARIILYFLELAKNQGWAEEINFIIIMKKYKTLFEQIDSLKKPIKKSSPKEEKPIKPENKKALNKKEDLTERQSQVIKVMNKVKSASIRDLDKKLSGLSRRTIIRELSELCEKGFLKKIGKGRSCYYVKMREN